MSKHLKQGSIDAVNVEQQRRSRGRKSNSEVHSMGMTSGIKQPCDYVCFPYHCKVNQTIGAKMFSLSHLKTKRYNQNNLNGVIWPKRSLENITVKYFSYNLISCSDKVCNLHRAFWVRKNQESNKYTSCQTVQTKCCL